MSPPLFLRSAVGYLSITTSAGGGRLVLYSGNNSKAVFDQNIPPPLQMENIVSQQLSGSELYMVSEFIFEHPQKIPHQITTTVYVFDAKNRFKQKSNRS